MRIWIMSLVAAGFVWEDPYSLVSTPLYSKQQHHDARCKQSKADKVKLVVQILDDFHGLGLGHATFRYATEDQHASNDSTRREVDVEAPTPAAVRVSVLFSPVIKQARIMTYVLYCVKAPPTRGPITAPSCAIPWHAPIRPGRWTSGTAAEMIVKAPFCRPAVPIPWMARPTISTFDEGATPQINEPSSKRAKKLMKTHLFLKLT